MMKRNPAEQSQQILKEPITSSFPGQKQMFQLAKRFLNYKL